MRERVDGHRPARRSPAGDVSETAWATWFAGTDEPSGVIRAVTPASGVPSITPVPSARRDAHRPEPHGLRRRPDGRPDRHVPRAQPESRPDTATPGTAEGDRWRTVGWWVRDLGFAGLVVFSVALAWLVLVMLRGPEQLVANDQLALRADATVAESLRADRIAAFGTWIVDLTTTLVIGGVIFRTLISTAAARPTGWSPARFLRGAAIVGAGASLAVLPFRAAALAGTGPVAVTDTSTLDFVVTSRFGTAALLRVAGLFVAAFGVVDSGLRHRFDRGRRTAASRRSTPEAAEGMVANRLMGALGVGLLLASYAWIGHPQATKAPGPLLVLSQAVHVLAVSTWFGGVALLYLQIRAGRRAGAIRTSAEVVDRFSTAAGVSVAITVATGILLARSQVTTLEALTHGHYGRALLLKLALVAVVLVIGGFNKEFVVPRIVKRRGPAAWRMLHRTLLAEAVVLAAGVLVATTAMISGGI